MKKVLIILFLAAAFGFVLCSVSSAATVNELLTESGADALDGYGTGLTPDNITESLTVSSVFDYISGVLTKAVSGEAGFFALMTALVLTSMLFRALIGERLPMSVGTTVDTAVLVAMLLIISERLSEMCATADNAVQSIESFTKTLIPVITALLVTSGQPAAASASQGFLFAACELIVYISAYVIVPAVYLYFALCVAKALAPQLGLSGVCSLFKKAILGLIAVSLSVFTVIMSLQSVIAMTGDSVTKSGLKAAVSNLLPVVGAQLGETIETFYGCASAAKTLTGAFGTVLIASIALAPILSVAVKYAAVRLSGWLAELSGNERMSSVLRDTAGGFSMLIAVTAGAAACLTACLTVTTIVWRG